jgi:predicted O-methyltransferase YrrM
VFVDLSAFVRDLPARFGGDLYVDEPPDPRFDKVVADIEGMSTPHSLTLLNAAVDHLSKDEWYLEVGSYRGRSLVGASLGHEHGRFAAIENFREFGVDPQLAQTSVSETLERWGLGGRVRFLPGEAFKLLPKGAVHGPVGVYFYDGAHSRLAQYLGLACAEQWLADEALVIVDDATWPQVASSTQSYMDRHPGYELLFDLRAERDYDPRWCNGVKVYGWRRPRGWTPPGGLDITWRRIAHLYGQEPVMNVAWRVLPRYPRVSSVLKRAYLHGGTAVPKENGGA